MRRRGDKRMKNGESERIGSEEIRVRKIKDRVSMAWKLEATWQSPVGFFYDNLIVYRREPHRRLAPRRMKHYAPDKVVLFCNAGLDLARLSLVAERELIYDRVKTVDYFVGDRLAGNRRSPQRQHVAQKHPRIHVVGADVVDRGRNRSRLPRLG